MKADLSTTILALGIGTAFAQLGSEFEASDFNITEALIGNGIDVSAIPELSGLAERTLLSGCAIAVCPPTESIKCKLTIS